MQAVFPTADLYSLEGHDLHDEPDTSNPALQVNDVEVQVALEGQVKQFEFPAVGL